MATVATAVESRTAARSGGRFLYFCSIFAGAFLLFAIQPMIARVILPWFGGTAAVWTTCMLFFQVGLVAGYLYAYWSIRYLRPKTHVFLHVALLLASVLLLPITPGQSWKPSGAEDPTLRILSLLVTTIGMPYFLLSATGPLVQVWYSRASKGAVPYRLFALSNAGSLLALLSYPALVEPFLATRDQTRWWSAAYLGFVLLCSGAAMRSCFRSTLEPAAPVASTPESASLPWQLWLLWVALPACASALLLAITNHLSTTLVPIPFLWVLPLSLYLVSFILCFEGHGWYKREWYRRLLLLAFLGIVYGLFSFGEAMSPLLVIFTSAGALFVCCMVCHGELASLKPHPRYLTSFYLMCSLGGALGGIFVGLMAPYLFRGTFELILSLSGCVFLPALVMYWYPSGRSETIPKHKARRAIVVLAAALLVSVALQVHLWTSRARVTVRNFYGILRVLDWGRAGQQDARRTISSSMVNHGEQFLHPGRRRQPTAYFGPSSGVGLALLEAGRHSSLRVGIIGLGAGVLAAYGREGDDYRFYEINPAVIQLARTEFSFLRDCPARVDVVLGDGRLALEREPGQEFDLLAVDAFTGDSIPVHLLTKEALELYFHRLKPGGVLALHVSSLYLDLASVVDVGMKAMGKEARVVESAGDEKDRTLAATWILATEQQEFFESPAIRKVASRMNTRRDLRLWTDDYSNLIRVIR